MTERFGRDRTKQKMEPNIWVKLSILRSQSLFETFFACCWSVKQAIGPRYLTGLLNLTIPLKKMGLLSLHFAKRCGILHGECLHFERYLGRRELSDE
jgi:hypothetical protein